MASLSVDEKDWLQEQIRTEREFRLLPQRVKTWGQLRNAPKEYDLAKLDSDGTKIKHHVAQFERMQNQINSRYRMLILVIKRCNLAS
jgi:hypothetical protein